MNRCEWCLDGGVLQAYHDEEWGNLVHDDKKHFEYLLLEAMQCGLNWTMMLKKRGIFKEQFDNFDYELITKYDEVKVENIMNAEGMIKSRRKIEAIIESNTRIWKL